MRHGDHDLESSGDRLVCIECGRSADVYAHGWRAFVVPEVDDFEEMEQAEQADAELAVYCPECAAREFGTEP